MRNNVEYCAKVVPLHVQMMRKNSQKIFCMKKRIFFTQKLPFRENPNSVQRVNDVHELRVISTRLRVGRILLSAIKIERDKQ